MSGAGPRYNNETAMPQPPIYKSEAAKMAENGRDSLDVASSDVKAVYSTIPYGRYNTARSQGGSNYSGYSGDSMTDAAIAFGIGAMLF